MGGSVIGLDTLVSSMFHFVKQWSPELARSASRDLLRFVLIRLYDQGRGNLHTARLELAQTTLARKLGLSRQWVGELVQRLDAAGWIEHYSPVLADGTNGSTIFGIGRQLKRLLVMLGKSRRGKKPAKPAAKSTWRFSPSAEVKKLLLIQAQEKRPPEERVLAKIPLLRTWMGRGEKAALDSDPDHPLPLG
jgi:DNA-binding Lrp family transcriptional regulator